MKERIKKEFKVIVNNSDDVWDLFIDKDEIYCDNDLYCYVFGDVPYEKIKECGEESVYRRWNLTAILYDIDEAFTAFLKK